VTQTCNHANSSLCIITNQVITSLQHRVQRVDSSADDITHCNLFLPSLTHFHYECCWMRMNYHFIQQLSND